MAPAGELGAAPLPRSLGPWEAAGRLLGLEKRGQKGTVSPAVTPPGCWGQEAQTFPSCQLCPQGPQQPPQHLENICRCPQAHLGGVGALVGLVREALALLAGGDAGADGDGLHAGAAQRLLGVPRLHLLIRDGPQDVGGLEVT